jgi:fatty-acyl-CoA synthase
MTASMPRARKSDSISGVLERLAAHDPQRAVLVWDNRRISIGALLEESRRVAGGLAELGILAGDRVALWLPNSPAWLALYLACARLGAIAVAVNTRFRSSEIADILGRSGARLLVLWPDFRHIDFLTILTEADPFALDRLEGIVIYGSAASPELVKGKRTIPYDALNQHSRYTGDRGDGPLGSVIFTTSGTTKAPKFVLHDHYSVIEHARAVAPSFGYDAPETILLQALPFCGVFGFCQAMAALVAGAMTVLQPLFIAEEAARLIERHAVTTLNGSDEMLGRLLRTRNESGPFRSLKSVHFAAFNPSMSGLVAEAEQRGLRFAGLYGTSEVQALFARQRLGVPAHVRGQPGGFPVGDRYGVRVRDPESGHLLLHGESGELELAGPSCMVGYYGDAEATEKAMTADGWVRSGDLGHLLGDGSFVFETRMGDVLRLGGYLVAPSEIEAHIQCYPGIDGCQAVGAVGEDGPVVVAFVTLRPGFAFDEAALRQHCAKDLARFKTPARCVALEAFPTTPGANGAKVQRAKLREMAQRLLTA